MTVKELIAELKAFDSNMPVIIEIGKAGLSVRKSIDFVGSDWTIEKPEIVIFHKR